MLEFIAGAIVTLISVGFGASLVGLKKGNNDDATS